jgi:hypothetical protein
MPTPGVAFRFRRFRRRFGIAAPKLVVRSHVPWLWLGLLAMLGVVLAAVLYWLFVQRNDTGVMGREIQLLRLQLHEYGEELRSLRATEGTGQNAMSIERATQKQLMARIQQLERENGALKEDILLFERLVPVVGEDSAVRIENFRVMHDGKGQYHYRILMAFQPGKQNAEFRGYMQLAVIFVLGGKDHQVLFPEKRDLASEYQVEFKRFLRREGAFGLPQLAVIKSVELRVFQGDTLKDKRLAQL